MAQINHDLNLLYIIARGILPKEILEVLLYGSDFEEPDQEDLENIRQLVASNRGRDMLQLAVGGEREEVLIQEPPHWNS